MPEEDGQYSEEFIRFEQNAEWNGFISGLELMLEDAKRSKIRFETESTGWMRGDSDFLGEMLDLVEKYRGLPVKTDED